MTPLLFALLVVVGVGAGLVGYLAGLASLVSYPALLAVGLPPVSANVTNKSNVFTNTYRSQLDYTAAGGLSVTKKMSGRALTAGEFEFDVATTGDDKLGIAGHHTNAEAPDGGEAGLAPYGVTPVPLGD